MMKFTGWKAVTVIILLVAVFVIRIVSISNETDASLMEQLDVALMAEYFPEESARMKKAYDTGDEKIISDTAKSVGSTRMTIESVNASFSLFDFSNKNKDVVIRVAYSLSDMDGIRKKGVKYYLFSYTPLTNNWRREYDVSAVRYFMNFI